jgi:hypothetical protein
LLTLVLLALISPPSIVPLGPGTWWEYREILREKSGELWVATELETRFVVRGSVRRPFIDQEGGADPSPGPAEWGEAWLRLIPWTGEEALPLPLVVGATGAGMEEHLRGWEIEAEETLIVPAGEFRALRCALHAPEAESVLWIVPGVGVVRETHGTAGLPPQLERILVRWSGDPRRTPGGPASDAESQIPARPQRGRRTGHRTPIQ